MEAVGLGSHPFHLIGLSMGGSVTLCYSGTHPLCVAGASIICPASESKIFFYAETIKSGFKY